MSAAEPATSGSKGVAHCVEVPLFGSSKFARDDNLVVMSKGLTGDPGVRVESQKFIQDRI